MSTVQVVGDVIVARISPASVLIENSVLGRPAAAPQEQDRLARAVPGEVGLRAVGIEDPHVRDESGLVGLARAAGCRPTADAGVRGAEPADSRGRQLERERAFVQDHVVVAERLPLLEVHRAQAR